MKEMIRGVILFVLLAIGFGTCQTKVHAAGTAKPLDVQKEAAYEVLGIIGNNSNTGGTIENCGLFDGIQVNEWTGNNIMYWQEDFNYLEIDIKEDCNIWRSGTASWGDHNSPLTILKWDGNTYIDITSSVTQTVSNIPHTSWEKTISSLKAGKYKFTPNGYRIDSEWYLESTNAMEESSLKVVLEPEEELQLSVANDLSENTKLSWSSSDDNVATVNTLGIVTAIAKGETTITVNDSNNTYQDTIKILVVEDAEEYRLALDLNVGKSCRLTVDDYTFTKKITWSIMDNSIASVDSKGKITALAKGLTLVNATDENGKIVGQVYIRIRNITD